MKTSFIYKTHEGQFSHVRGTVTKTTVNEEGKLVVVQIVKPEQPMHVFHVGADRTVLIEETVNGESFTYNVGTIEDSFILR